MPSSRKRTSEIRHRKAVRQNSRFFASPRLRQGYRIWSFHMRDVSTSRPCERRDPYAADARFGTGAKAFLHFEARGDGSLRSKERPAERSCEATTVATHG